MKRLLLIAALFGTLIIAGNIPQAQAGVGVYGRAYNPAGNTCGSNCRFFVHDYTNADLKSWPVHALFTFPAVNMYCYETGGSPCWVAGVQYNASGEATWIGHNYQAYVRFTCADGHFKYTVGKSFRVADGIYNWWLGKFTFQSAC